MTTYSTAEVQIKLGEILGKVKEGETIVLLEGEEAVAEIRPAQTLEATLRQLEEEGIISLPTEPRAELRPLGERPGGLARFLESRR